MTEDNIVVLADRRVAQPTVPLCVVTVCDGGEVRLWLADDLETTEQFNWLFAKLVHALSAINRTKGDRTGLT